jgi:hypothetical protein
MHVVLRGPEATRTGTVSIGYLPMASFLDGGSGQATSYTVARLKSIASHVIDLKKTCEFDMYGAVVDHDAVSHANITFSTAASELL